MPGLVLGIQQSHESTPRTDLDHRNKSADDKISGLADYSVGL
jgi:hypothetical protein